MASKNILLYLLFIYKKFIYLSKYENLLIARDILIIIIK